MAGWLLGLGLFFVAGCAPPARQPEPYFLTPIPLATVSAYRAVYPLEETRAAVLKARQELGGVHFRPVGDQIVLSAERMNLSEAAKRIEEPGSFSSYGLPADAAVWLVLFQGYTQVEPPDPGREATPIPPFLGCTYVMLDANQEGGTVVSGSACPPGLPPWPGASPTSPPSRAYP